MYGAISPTPQNRHWKPVELCSAALSGGWPFRWVKTDSGFRAEWMWTSSPQSRSKTSWSVSVPVCGLKAGSMFVSFYFILFCWVAQKRTSWGTLALSFVKSPAMTPAWHRGTYHQGGGSPPWETVQFGMAPGGHKNNKYTSLHTGISWAIFLTVKIFCRGMEAFKDVLPEGQVGRTNTPFICVCFKATLANWAANNPTLLCLNVISTLLSFPSLVKNMGVLPDAKILSWWSIRASFINCFCPENTMHQKCHPLN